jgi:hypothetical protein
MKLRAALGYTAAGLKVAAAILTPFVLMGMFAKGFIGLGLHVDEMYSGGPKIRTIQEGAYSIVIHRVVYPHMLQSERPFVQLDWSPVSALPAKVPNVIDIDGDGQPDVHVSFMVPSDAKAPLHVDVEPIDTRGMQDEPREARNEAVRNAGKERYSRLIVRVDNSILVRIPVAKP